MTTYSDLPAITSYSKYRSIRYWIVTAILVLELFNSALWDFNLLNKGFIYGVLQHLGYPTYLANILGGSKIVAALVILAPGWRILKEWAYAGVVFLFTGAFVSHLIVGDGPSQFIWPLSFGILALVAYKWNYRK